MGKVDDERGGVSEPVHAWTFQAREPGDPISFRNAVWQYHCAAERSANLSEGTADMNADGKSDGRNQKESKGSEESKSKSQIKGVRSL
jgi:hypothetical protein